MRTSKLWLFLSAACFSAVAAPTVINVTNAALPSIDQPAEPTIHLAPRSMGTIFGTDLADVTASAAPPWPKVVGGTEVHLLIESATVSNATIPCGGNCDVALDLVFVSPTQINFVTPDLSISALETGRIVFVRNGVRYDPRADIFGTPGNIILDPLYDYDSAVFGIGYDCLFSSSSIDPASCGLSWSPGKERALMGAVTDASGDLVTTQNPVHQGEFIVLWMTELAGLKLDPKTGLIQQANPASFGFGVAQNGVDLLWYDLYGDWHDSLGHGGFGRVAATWAGESPQFPGLDQATVKFSPVCTATVTATVDKRYDAFIEFASIETGNSARIYFPFLVRAGDPDCKW